MTKPIPLSKQYELLEKNVKRTEEIITAIREQQYDALVALACCSLYSDENELGIEQVTLNKPHISLNNEKSIDRVKDIVQVIESNAYYYDDPDYKHTDTFEDFCEYITRGFTVEELFSVMTEIYNNHVIPCGAAQRVYTGLIRNIEW